MKLMTISRRGFIASLAAAITGAAVAPELVALPAASVKAAPGALTYATLNETYMQCWYGTNEPDMIMVSPRTYAEIVSRIAPMYRYDQEGPGGNRGLAFNGATIGVSRYMKDNQVWVQNSRKPLDPKFNRLIELVED